MANILPGENVNDFLMPKWGSLGSFGEVNFTCSSSTVRTFADLKRETKARFATHERVNQSPVLEFLGPALEEISFRMILIKKRGVNPARETEKLRKLCREGNAEFLVIGNEVFGQFVIENVSEGQSIYDGQGRCLATEVEVKMREYDLSGAETQLTALQTLFKEAGIWLGN